jgi:small-conductance mechanosensitive channel
MNIDRILRFAIPCALSLYCALSVAAPPEILIPTPTELAAQRAEVEKRLSIAAARLKSAAEAQRQHPAPDRPASGTKTAPKMTEIWQHFMDLYRGQLDDIIKLQELQIAIDAATKALDDWRPPPGSPPWPLTQGDEATLSLYQAQSQSTQLAARLELLGQQLEDSRHDLDEAQANARLVEETSLSQGTDIDPTQQQKAEYARLTVDYMEEFVYGLELKRQTVMQERKLKGLEIQRLQQRLNYFDGRYAMSAEALATINQEYDQKIEQLRRLQAEVSAEMGETERRLATLRKTGPVPSVQSVDSALAPDGTSAEIDSLLADQERRKSKVELYRGQIEILDGLKTLSSIRAELYSQRKPDHAEMLKLEDELGKVKQRIERISHAYRLLIESNTETAAELQERLAQNVPDAESHLLNARLESATGQTQDALEVLRNIKKLSMFMRLVTSEIDRLYRSGGLQMWLNNAWVEAGVWANALWDHELLTVDDTLKVEGREIRTTRSVTVGKSIGAVLILVVGYLLISWMIRALLSLVVGRLGVATSSASLIGRWLRLIAIATLVLLAFYLVSIPLTIFTFLGGALAIGLGFGTQNLLKNLVSGVMLLAERPVRIGDLVEVDSVRGRVTSIGIRFSTISTSNGMDMLIPNSTLVEQKLINWTYSNPELRSELRVGVAYGSDANQVRDILQRAAKTHPAVIDTPTPVVLLEDFGQSSLIFTLRFWIRMTPGSDDKRVASDLRFTILDALTAAGVVLPSSDPHVYLHPDSPLAIGR